MVTAMSIYAMRIGGTPQFSRVLLLRPRTSRGAKVGAGVGRFSEVGGAVVARAGTG